MSTDIVDRKQFADMMRDTVLSALVSFLPPEKINEMISAEIDAFFAPNADFKFDVERATYGNEFLRAKCPVSPFRVIVWTELRKVITPVLEQRIAGSTEELDKKLIEFFNNTQKQDFVNDFTNALASVAMLQQQLQLANAMSASVYGLKTQVSQALANAGLPSTLY